MKYKLINNTPMIDVCLIVNGKEVIIKNTVIDTGCSHTVFAASAFKNKGLRLNAKRLEKALSLSGKELHYLAIELDNMIIGKEHESDFNRVYIADFDAPINGLLGMDFLRHAKAKIDVVNNELNLGE